LFVIDGQGNSTGIGFVTETGNLKCKMTDIQIQMPAMLSRSSLKNNNNSNGNTGHDDDAGRLTSQDDLVEPTSSSSARDSAGGWYETMRPRISLLQKAGAELMSTFILVFAGCGAIMVDAHRGGVVTHVGISLTFGLVVAAMIYTVGHVSGAHMNPAVTIAFALTKHFPWCQVPVYVAAQCAGGIAASFVLGLILHPAAFEGATLPSGSDAQSLVLEIIITFVLMFVISAVATDTRAVRTFFRNTNPSHPFKIGFIHSFIHSFIPSN
jgi:glycerol uptake facilitator-like aquaporin